MNNLVTTSDKNAEGDSISSYFECITECSILNDHKECVTQCIEIHLKGSNQNE